MIRLPLPACAPLLLLACVAPRTGPATRAVAPGVGATAIATAADSRGAEPVPEMQLPADVRPVRYALDLEVDPARDAGLRGRATIEVELDRQRRTIWLHARELRVHEVGVEVDGSQVPATFSQATRLGVARLELARPVGPGRIQLRFAWEAPWQDGIGPARARDGADLYVSTQLEAIDARRLFPGFDEPRFKTPFDVTLTVPAGLVAISNGPEVASAPAGALRRITFATTRPLPTYLIFFTVGPYDVVEDRLPPNEVRARPLTVRYLAPRGRGAETAYAREAGAALLVELERYFGTPFPYPKLDHLAIPSFPWGGMENAGAIAYRDGYLLFDPHRQGEVDRRTTALVLAHEMAHQWFGDLVTPEWWTEIWLNESFATWMERLVLERWRPGLAAGEQSGAKATAVAVDALPGARAVRTPLPRMEELQGQFDNIAYEKGASVLGMFERYVGEERFRDAIRRYVTAHADGTGSTAAFIAELSRAAGRDLAGPLGSFLDQPGLPAIAARVRCADGRAQVMLSQQPFRPRGLEGAPGASWQVPVCVRYRAAGADRERCTLLEGAAGTLDLPEGCPEWVVPDAGGAGYYRWTLAPADLARLTSRGLERLRVEERVSLAQSLRAAQQSGALPFAEAMRALELLARDPDPSVASEVIAALVHAHDHLAPGPAQRAIRQRAIRLYRPALARLGWTARAGERPVTQAHRRAVVRLLALVAREPEVRREAARRGRAYLAAAPGRASIDPELVPVALAAALDEGGSAVFDKVLARLGEVRESDVRDRLLQALAGVRDHALVERYYALVETGRTPPSAWVKALARRALPDGGAGADRALGALEARLGAVLPRLPELAAADLPAALEPLCSRDAERRMRALFEPRLGERPEMAPALRESLGSIQVCVAEREAVGAAVAAYFGVP